MSTPSPSNPAAPTPEPLISTELARTVVLALLALSGASVSLPDPVLAVVVPIVGSLLTIGASWGLTLIARGKVWALREGVDVDQVVAYIEANTGPEVVVHGGETLTETARGNYVTMSPRAEQ